MAQIEDCIGKRVRISRRSITIKTEDGKTCGVVKDIISLYDLQANRQILYHRQLYSLGVHGKIPISECIIKDGVMYVFHNIRSKLFHERYGYLSEEEEAGAEAKEKVYDILKANGISVIECIFV